MKLIDIIDSTPISYGYRIAFLTNFFRGPLLRDLEKNYGIIRPEWTVLICLSYKEGVTSKDICEVTEQPSNTVSRAVSSLIEKKLIRRKIDKNDGRRSLLYISAAGRKLNSTIMKEFVLVEQTMTECLTSDELEQLDVLLDKLCRHVPFWRIE